MRTILKVIIPILLFSFSSHQLISQEDKVSIDTLNAEEKVKSGGLFLQILGTTPVAGLGLEVLIDDLLEAEIGVGFLSFGVGATIYPWRVRPDKLLFHTGFKYSQYTYLFDGGNYYYVPLGVTYFSGKRANYSIDVGPGRENYNVSSYSEESGFFVMGSIKFAFRF